MAATLELHKQLAATPDFAAGLDWLVAHPVPASICYRYFKKLRSRLDHAAVA